MTTAAAFFDLDRTLMSGSSAYYFGKAAYREGLRPWHRMLSDLLNTVVFRLFGASDEKSQAVRDAILESVAGKAAADLHRMAPGVIEEILPNIRPEAQALLEIVGLVRGMSVAAVRAIVTGRIETPMLGAPHVNVLAMNRALDAAPR